MFRIINILVGAAIFAGLALAQNTTVPGNFRVLGTVRMDSVAGDTLRMMVIDTLGRVSSQTIPTGGGGGGPSPANPTATLGLSAINGSAATFMRSDAAPALSQAITPTWTGAHTFNAAAAFGSTITTPLTASRLLALNASSQLAANAALTANGFTYATAAGGLASTSAAGNGQILIGSAGVAPVLGTLTGTSNQISVSQGAGTLGLSIPNTLVVPDSLNVASLAGSGTRMVVAGADGGIFAQDVPSGLTGSGASGQVAFWTGTSALSSENTLTYNPTTNHLQTSLLSVTGVGTFSNAIVFNGIGDAGSNRIYRNETDGIAVRGTPGSSYDWAIQESDGTTLIANPIGGNDVRFPQLSGASTRMVVADADGDISTQAIPSGVSPANPTASVGLSAVNGSASTYLRSDGAPALSQSIAPTWTGAHSFTAGFNAHTGTNAGQATMAGGSSTNNAGDGGWVMVSGATTPTMAGYVEVRSSTVTGTLDTGTVRIWPAAGGSTRFGRIDEGNRWAAHVQGDLKVDDSVMVVGRLGHGATVKYIDTIAATTIPLNTSDLITMELTGDVTLTMQTGAATGRHVTLRLHQDETGGHDITWASEFEFPEDAQPTQVTTADSWSYYSFMYNEISNTWDYVGGALGFGGAE